MFKKFRSQAVKSDRPSSKDIREWAFVVLGHIDGFAVTKTKVIEDLKILCKVPEQGIEIWYREIPVYHSFCMNEIKTLRYNYGSWVNKLQFKADFIKQQQAEDWHARFADLVEED